MRWNLRYDFQEEVEIEANLEKKKTQLSKVIFVIVLFVYNN